MITAAAALPFCTICRSAYFGDSSWFAAETLTADFTHGVVTPNQLRWRPFPLPADNEVG